MLCCRGCCQPQRHSLLAPERGTRLFAAVGGRFEAPGNKKTPKGGHLWTYWNKIQSPRKS
eukprot:2352765-Amphidinium_carterae.1